MFAADHKNNSCLRLVQTWPMDLDSVCLEMLEAHHPIALLILAHYATLMSMRSNYWFFKGWSHLLLDAITNLLPSDWHKYLKWPHRVIHSE